MTLRMPGVPYMGPPDDNYGGTIVRPPAGMVVHIAEGSYQGTIAWQKNSIADVSSYFVTSRAGEIAQMLDLDLMAWTQGAGNAAWIGVENEGFHTEAFTDAQVDANAAIFAWLRTVWPSIPAQVTNSPSVGGLGWHGMGGVPWGNHPDCPGPANVALLPTILARATGGTPPLPPKDEDMPKLLRINETGVTIITNGPTWYRLGLDTDRTVEAAKIIWGQNPSPLSLSDLPSCGVEVPFPGNGGSGGPATISGTFTGTSTPA